MFPKHAACLISLKFSALSGNRKDHYFHPSMPSYKRLISKMLPQLYIWIIIIIIIIITIIIIAFIDPLKTTMFTIV